MAYNGTKIVDFDSHLVGDVSNWPHFIDEEWRDYLPKPLPTGPEERRRTLIGNQIMIGAEVTRNAGEKPNWATAHDYTAEGRVANLDQDQIDCAVLSPNSPALDLAWFPEDPRLAAAFCRAENGYMAHYASFFPERLKWAGLIPWQDAEEAVKELHRAHEMGSVGVNMKAVPVLGRECWDRYYDPIYADLERLGMPIIIHDTKFWSMGVERFADNFFYSHMVGRVIEGMVMLMAIICGGVLERFPGLRVVLLEGGASHMPWWLSRMDEHYEKLPHLVPWLRMEPSAYFNRQVFVGCGPFEDAHFEMAIEMLGDDNFILATDNPHWDSAPPGQVTKPVFESTRLSEETKRKVLGGNAATLIEV